MRLQWGELLLSCHLFFLYEFGEEKDLQTSRLSEAAGSFREQIEGQHCFLFSASRHSRSRKSMQSEPV